MPVLAYVHHLFNVDQCHSCIHILFKPCLRVFRGISKANLVGYVGFFQFLRRIGKTNGIFASQPAAVLARGDCRALSAPRPSAGAACSKA
jgi:hypothetical protein